MGLDEEACVWCWLNDRGEVTDCTLKCSVCASCVKKNFYDGNVKGNSTILNDAEKRFTMHEETCLLCKKKKFSTLLYFCYDCCYEIKHKNHVYKIHACYKCINKKTERANQFLKPEPCEHCD